MITMPFGPCTNIELRIALSFRVFVFCLVRYRGLNYLNLHANLVNKTKLSKQN